MTWDDFAPFVLPWAPGCPDATMEHHVKLAAIDFCRATLVWRADLAALAGDGVATAFTLPLPTDAEVSELLGVTITATGLAPVQAGIKNFETGAQMVRDEANETIAYTPDRRALVVWPAQATGASIVATAALKPSMAAATFPDVLFGNYAQDIAGGALATLLSMPKQEWTDLQAAAIRAGQFNSRKSTTARTAANGFAKSSRRQATRWF